MQEQIRTNRNLLFIVALLSGIAFLSSGIVILSMPACDPPEIGREQPFVSATDDSESIQIKLEISRAPRLGETAELTLTIIPHDLPAQEVTNSRAWIEAKWKNTTGSFLESRQKTDIPTANILASEKSSWDITLTEGEPVEMHSTIRFTQEGDWEINGVLEMDDWGSIWGYPIRLSVYQDRAGIVGSAAYVAGELEWRKVASLISTATRLESDVPIANHDREADA